MNSLYRFISFPSFINLVEHKTERYVSPSTWEDTCEGYFLHLLEKDNVEESMIGLMNNISPNNAEAAMENYLKLCSARWLCYGQCWTTLPESDAFWRIYSYDNMAIRIETAEQQIKALFAVDGLSEKYSLEIDDVQYDLDKNGTLKTRIELMTEIHETKRVTEPYYHKRIAFEHEHEKRVILLDNEGFKWRASFPARAALNNFRLKNNGKTLSTEDAIKSLAEEMLKLKYPFSKDNTDNAIDIPIPKLNSYIKSVMVHPQAKPWIVELVKTICSRTGLNFAGQSTMYNGIS